MRGPVPQAPAEAAGLAGADGASEGNAISESGSTFLPYDFPLTLAAADA